MEKYNLGIKIRNFRKRVGISQLELEINIDCSSGTISRIENGDVNPSKETLIKIAKALRLNSAETASLFGIETTKTVSVDKERLNSLLIELIGILQSDS